MDTITLRCLSIVDGHGGVTGKIRPDIFDNVNVLCDNEDDRDGRDCKWQRRIKVAVIPKILICI